MVRLRDPRGNIHDIVYDPQKTPKPAFNAALNGYYVGFAPIGDMNGYNTQFATQVIPQKDSSIMETWEVLGIKFPIKTPQFQVLDEERSAALREITRTKLSQKAAAQELKSLSIPPKAEK
jgi:hypothetical protein